MGINKVIKFGEINKKHTHTHTNIFFIKTGERGGGGQGK